MYISLNNERIVFHFNPEIALKISGPDSFYYVELREYPKNDDMSLLVESYKISGSNDSEFRKVFHVPIQFYGDWEVSVYKYVNDFGLKRIYTHRYNDYGKIVRFNLDTENFDECALWKSRIDLYCKINGCRPQIYSDFDEINKSVETYYNIQGIDTYKTYNIGRYPKKSNDFRTTDHRKEGVIWYGNWKTFWSYEHPRNWNDLTSQEIVDDILGLS